QEGRAERAEPLLKGAHSLDRADLKGQMVEAYLVRGKPPFTLLPERKNRRAILAQKRELSPRLLGLPEHLEPKDLLVELRRSREIAYIQTDMAGLYGRYHGKRRHRYTS